MKYNINEMDLLSDWIEIVKTDLNDRGFSTAGLRNNEIGILYLTYQKRSIKPVTRTIIKSTEFVCPPALQTGLSMLENEIRSGNDLTPYLSKEMSDLSYNDKMLFDWDIHHFHLGETIDSRGLRARTGPLLFARIVDDKIYFLQILGHGNWTQKALIKIMHDNWPDSIKNFRINATALSVNFSNEEHKDLQKNKINVLMELEPGVIYMGPGQGIAGNGGSIDAVIRYLGHVHQFKRFAKQIELTLDNYIDITDESLDPNLNFHLVKADGLYYIHEQTNDFSTQINGPV